MPDQPSSLTHLSLKPPTSGGLNADFYYRTGATPQPALILLGGSEGGKMWSEQPEAVEQFVRMGYAVLSLGYFAAEGLPAGLRAIPLEYFQRAFDWLDAQEGVITGQHHVLGVSRGAELALLLAGRFPQVRSVIAIAPSSVVFPGPPTGLPDALRGQHSAWSEQGQEIPFVPVPFSWTTLQGMINGKRTRMFEEALKNKTAVDTAGIPVENICGNVLLESFTQDQIWPSALMAEQIVTRLKAHNFPYACKHTAHPRGHADWSYAPCWAEILSFLSDNIR